MFVMLELRKNIIIVINIFMLFMLALRFLKRIISFILVLQILFPWWVRAMSLINEKENISLPYMKGEILVKFKESYINMHESSEMGLLMEKMNQWDKIVKDVIKDGKIILNKNNESFLRDALDFWIGNETKDIVPDLIKKYERNPNVEYVQPNFLHTESNDNTFNDPLYNNQWYLNNTWQEIRDKNWSVINGRNDIDINYPEARMIYDTAYNRLNTNQKNQFLLEWLIQE